jgi:hypothetical protein
MDTRNYQPQLNESARLNGELLEVSAARHSDVFRAIANLENSSFNFSDVEIEYSNAPAMTETATSGAVSVKSYAPAAIPGAQQATEVMPTQSFPANPIVTNENAIPGTGTMSPEQVQAIAEAKRKVNEAIAIAANPAFVPYDDQSATFEHRRVA